MTFKEFFDMKHPELGGKWGRVHEDSLQEALERQMNAVAEYIDEKLKEKKHK